MSRLTPCPQCHRHVRLEESSCPFCSSRLSPGAAPRSLPTAGLKRAALFALTATVASTACGGDDDDSSTSDAQQQQQHNPSASPTNAENPTSGGNPTGPTPTSAELPGASDPSGPTNPVNPTTPGAPTTGTPNPLGPGATPSGSADPVRPNPGGPSNSGPGGIGFPSGPGDVPTAMALYGAVPAPIDGPPVGNGGASNAPFQPEATDGSDIADEDDDGGFEVDAGASIEPEGPPQVQPLYGAPISIDD